MNESMEDRKEQDHEDEKQHDGIWIGIDLGTSNSTCAVWDSSRGGAKWCVRACVRVCIHTCIPVITHSIANRLRVPIALLF